MEKKFIETIFDRKLDNNGGETTSEQQVAKISRNSFFAKSSKMTQKKFIHFNPIKIQLNAASIDK